MSFGDLEAGCLAIILFQRLASLDLHGPNQDAPRQPVHVNSVFLGDPGFLCWFDPVQSGIGEYPLSEMRSLGPDLNGLVSEEDQLSPGLSDAEGSHTGLQAAPWEISHRRRIERMYVFSSDVRACPLGIKCHFSRHPRSAARRRNRRRKDDLASLSKTSSRSLFILQAH